MSGLVPTSGAEPLTVVAQMSIGVEFSSVFVDRVTATRDGTSWSVNTTDTSLTFHFTDPDLLEVAAAALTNAAQSLRTAIVTATAAVATPPKPDVTA